MFCENDTIITLVEKNGIPKGAVGTIVICHNDGEEYEVEFCDSNSETTTFVVYSAEDIKSF